MAVTHGHASASWRFCLQNSAPHTARRTTGTPEALEKFETESTSGSEKTATRAVPVGASVLAVQVRLGRMSGACAVQMQETHGTAEHEKTGLADNLSRRQRLVLFLFVIAVVTNGACRVKWSRAFDVSMSTRWKVTTLLRSRCRSTCMWSTAVLCYDDAAQCTRCQQRL